MAQVLITAASTLIAVGLGGWLTTRAQDRLWRRDHQRQWRDIRRSAYTEFLTAFREYVSYVLLPTPQIRAVPRPRPPNDLMPFFDEAGTTYKERLEATKTALRLVSSELAIVQASSQMVRCARALAADRATISVELVPSERFEELWAAEREFVAVARAELGLRRLLPPEDRGRPSQEVSAALAQGRE